MQLNEAHEGPVLESTVAMIGGLFAAWLFLRHDPARVMPLAALAVGAHYFAFRTAYGLFAFWGLGGVIVAMRLGAIYAVLPLGGSLGVVEIAFGLVLTVRAVM